MSAADAGGNKAVLESCARSERRKCSSRATTLGEDSPPVAADDRPGPQRTQQHPRAPGRPALEKTYCTLAHPVNYRRYVAAWSLVEIPWDLVTWSAATSPTRAPFARARPSPAPPSRFAGADIIFPPGALPPCVMLCLQRCQCAQREPKPPACQPRRQVAPPFHSFL